TGKDESGRNQKRSRLGKRFLQQARRLQRQWTSLSPLRRLEKRTNHAIGKQVATDDSVHIAANLVEESIRGHGAGSGLLIIVPGPLVEVNFFCNRLRSSLALHLSGDLALYCSSGSSPRSDRPKCMAQLNMETTMQQYDGYEFLKVEA